MAFGDFVLGQYMKLRSKSPASKQQFPAPVDHSQASPEGQFIRRIAHIDSAPRTYSEDPSVTAAFEDAELQLDALFF